MFLKKDIWWYRTLSNQPKPGHIFRATKTGKWKTNEKANMTDI